MAVYCTRSDLSHRASEEAVDLRLDDDATDDSITATIDDASAEIDLYLDPNYDASTYAANRWVKYACVTVALYYLCERRLESVPASAAARYKRQMEQLERVRTGKLRVPGLAAKKQLAPVLSQPRVSLWPYPRAVNQRGNATGKPAGYTPKDDPLEPPQLP